MTTDAWLTRAFRVILVYLVGNWLLPGKLSHHNSPRHRRYRYYDILRHSTRQCDNQLLQGVAMSTSPHFGLQMLLWYFLGLMEFLGNDSKCSVWDRGNQFQFRIAAFLMRTREEAFSTIALPIFFPNCDVFTILCPSIIVSKGIFLVM